MRILFLNPVGVLGGAERALLDLLACLRRLEPTLSLHLLAGTEGPLLDEARALGVDARLLPLPEQLSALGDSGLRGQGARALWGLAKGLAPAPGLLTGYLRELRREVRALRPQLIHSNGIKTHLLSPATVGLPVPRVWHIHDFIGERPLVRQALRGLRPLATLAIANSRAVGMDAREVLGSVPVQVVYNGVDVERFAPAQGEGSRLDALAGLPPAPEGILRIGLVATYARWKGQEVFLEAAARLLQQRPGLPARFYLVGSPLYRTQDSQYSEEELRGRMSHWGLGGHVGLVPFQREPEAVYRALDIFVHASTRREPFGLTIAEALACGRPAIISRASGAAELLTEGVDALTLPSGDTEALARAMRQLAEDPALRERLGQAARRTAVERFSRDRYAREILDIYRSLVSAGDAP
ncbi:glycosyltransferase family 4 protein [Hyalangium minutum]|uniref:Glycosyltransferase n=1 Tax=Hyalangium minutum TaxID=394096 RepID=A0A085WUY6_9BACT|nr:glycosyltransferase family 4 protein [Hyalangium minutum]KFE71499.1 Glycosyltransferase [Hyalangium minutum]